MYKIRYGAVPIIPAHQRAILRESVVTCYEMLKLRIPDDKENKTLPAREIQYKKKMTMSHFQFFTVEKPQAMQDHRLFSGTYIVHVPQRKGFSFCGECVSCDVMWVGN